MDTTKHPPWLFQPEERDLPARHERIDKRLGLSIPYKKAQPAHQLTRCKCTCDKTVYEELNKKECRMVTLGLFDWSLDDVVSDVEQCNASITPRMQRGSVTSIWTNIDSGEKAVAIAK